MVTVVEDDKVVELVSVLDWVPVLEVDENFEEDPVVYVVAVV